MAKYRSRLPQLGSDLFLTDGGIETSLIFHDGLELPYFAAFHLLKDAAGRSALQRYFTRYAEVARTQGTGFVLESPTWRASPDWGAKLGYSEAELAEANRASIALMEEIRVAFETEAAPFVISGCIGPRGDGYDPGDAMTPDEAEAYHAFQARIFEAAGADMITAITMSNASEAIGVTRAARMAGLPVVISFTLETDGRLPTGQTLEDAVTEVDEATDRGPAYYMINCAHPTHFEDVLRGGSWLERLGGLRANASRRSHEELDEATDLDDGDPVELGGQYGDLHRRFPQIKVLGGCCGTDHRHIEQIGAACRVAA